MAGTLQTETKLSNVLEGVDSAVIRQSSLKWQNLIVIRQSSLIAPSLLITRVATRLWYSSFDAAGQHNLPEAFRQSTCFPSACLCVARRDANFLGTARPRNSEGVR